MTDLKRIYQSDLPSRAIAVYLYLRGRANKEDSAGRRFLLWRGS